MGNAVFDGKIIRQDRLTPLKTLIPLFDNQFEKIFENYAKSILEGWKYGFNEITYNFAVNCGINNKGKVVLMDFGELTFDKRKVQNI